MRRALLIASAAVLIGARVIAGSVLIGGSAKRPADDRRVPAATARVIRTTLVETKAVPGTLGYADTFVITNALATSSYPSAAIQSYIAALSEFNAAANALDLLRGPKPREVAQAQAQLAQAEGALLSAEQAASGPTEKDVAQAKAQLASAQAQLAKAQVIGPTAGQVAQAQAQLAVAQAQLIRAQNAAAGPSAAQVAQAQAAVTQAAATLASDQASLTRAQDALAACQVPSPAPSCDVPALQVAVQQAQARVTADQAQLSSAQAQLAALSSPEVKAEAQANLAAAQAAVDSAKAALSALTVVPSGTTLAELASALFASRSAQAALDALLNGNAAQAAAQLKTARAQLSAAQPTLDALRRPRAAQLNQAQDAVSTAKMQLEAAQEKLGRPRGVVTQIAEVGSVVGARGVLYALDGGRPAVLMTGAVPAWRRLEESVPDGADVEQLEANLQALGLGSPTLVVDQHWDAETTAAVQRWQRTFGQADTGVIPLGTLVFEPGPMRITAQLATLNATIQQGAAVLQATSTNRVVTIALQPALQINVKQGDPVSVTLPDGKTASGRISYISKVAAKAEGGAAGGTSASAASAVAASTIAVLATLDQPWSTGDLDQAAVTVNIATATAKDVLAVPVAALLALVDGGFGVEIVADRATRIVPVKTGMFAAGQVEIRGEGIAEGMTVVVPR